jgi:thiol-disulfide isomerase/thioredoxin
MKTMVCVGGLLCVAMLVAGPVLANERIAGARDTMMGLATKMDTGGTYKVAAEIVAVAGKMGSEKLTSADLWAVGMARYYLGIQSLEQALQMGGLADADTARAQQLIQQAWTKPMEQTCNAPLPDKVRTIGHGATIDMSAYLVPGKTTIVDFYSEYCTPCRQLGPHIEALVKGRDDLMLVKVDLNRPGHVGIDWQSPVAQQFHLDGIPHLKIYGPDGKLQSEGEPALNQVLDWGGQK